MKIFILLSTLLFAFCSSVLSQQCPPSGLRVITPLCETPQNLQVSNVTSSALQVKWKGKKNQTYIINSTYLDISTNQTIEAETSQSSCDNNGNCLAIIPVKAGTKVNWSVQAICSEGGAILYSYTQDGVAMEIPANQKPTDNTITTIRVYPNPTTGPLTIEYHGKIEGNIEFRVLDVSGKSVFQQSGGAAEETSNRYQLDLHSLIPGTYLLQARNGNKVDITKFVLFRK